MGKRKVVQPFEGRRDAFLGKHNLTSAYNALIASQTPEAVAEALETLIEAMQRSVGKINEFTRAGSAFFCVEIVIDAAKILARNPAISYDDKVKEIFWASVRSPDADKFGFLRDSVVRYAANEERSESSVYGELERQLLEAFDPETNPQAIVPARLHGRHR